jgi:phosphoribosylamine--glycine ligase
MNILILGSGGREHALAWKIHQSPLLDNLFIAPGNSGTALLGRNISLDPNDFDAVTELISKNDIALVVVGPEAPLVNGIWDHLTGIFPELMIIGPGADGARLEGSKDFAKSFMQRYHIPTAAYRSFGKDEIDSARAFLQETRPPYVLKADGLAAGKGVVIASTIEDAETTLDNMLLEGQFGQASEKVVIEEFLDGIEVSFFVLTDGQDYLILPEAKDYKRIGEQDTGPNTGGMGAVSPVPFATPSFIQKVEEKIIRPTINGINQEKFNYCGFLFFGLMKVGDEPYVIEYNVRLGDPETQVVLPRIKGDLVPILTATANKKLAHIDLPIHTNTMTTVVAVSAGYPGSYEKGKAITLGKTIEDTLIFHAGSQMSKGLWSTTGGRVLAVTGIAEQIKDALEKSYSQLSHINWDGIYYRKDIGFDLI